MAKRKETPPQDKKSSLSDLRAKYGRPDTVFHDTKISVINDLWGGGIPSGKIIEIHSDAGLGKTTLSIQIARGAYLENGLKVGFLDTEHALDVSLKRAMEIHLKYEFDDPETPSFCHLSPAYYGEIEEATYFLMQNGYNLIILDSLTNAVPDARTDGSITKSRPGIKSMMQSLYLEQFKPLLARAGITLILVNHMRFNIKLMGSTMLEPAGGKALQFDTDIRMGMSRKAWNKKGDEIVGTQLALQTIKNKLTQPFRVTLCNFVFGKGINEIASLFDLALDRGIIKQSGSYFSWGDSKIGQGRDKAETVVKENVDKIREELGELTSLVNETNISSMQDADESDFEKP